jgi:hypothetical protein
MDKPHETNNDHQQQIDELLKRSQQEQTSSLFCDMPEHLTIRSVVPLTEQERTQIVELFSTIIERPLGNVTEIIDLNLICGVSLQSDSHYFEVSGRQQLQKMKLKFHTQV